LIVNDEISEFKYDDEFKLKYKSNNKADSIDEINKEIEARESLVSTK